MAGLAWWPEGDAGSPAVTTGPEPGGDLVEVEVPIDGWRLSVPPDWTVQSWSLSCRQDSGVLVTSLADRVEERTTTEGCGFTWDQDQLRRPGRAWVELRSVPAEELPPGATVLAPSATLSLDRVPPVERSPERLDHEVYVRDERDQVVRIQIGGNGVLAQEDAELEAVLDALRWPGRDPAAVGFVVPAALDDGAAASTLACMVDAGHRPRVVADDEVLVEGRAGAVVRWLDGGTAREPASVSLEACTRLAQERWTERTNSFRSWPPREGPSQDPDDAWRDGVVAELAARTLDDRAFPLALIDTAEGAWVLSRPPDPNEGDCTIGDPDGEWGRDWICSQSYAELLLLDDEGSVVEAIPLPGSAPTWMTVTAEAVFAGTAANGDGDDAGADELEDLVVRVDRDTLDAEVVVLPVADGVLNVDWPRWTVAPDGVSLAVLATTDGTDLGTLVASTGRPTSVDLDAIETLFE
jgi:hypothetical protein